MADSYKVVGTDNSTVDWTSEVVLEKDEETGEPTKVVSAEVPAELSKDDLETLENLGVKVEKVSAAEVKEAEQKAAVATDTAASGPLLGNTDQSSGVKSGSNDNDDKK